MPDTIRTETLNSSLLVLLEPVAGVASAAVNWLLPAGSASDTADGVGVSTLLSEMVFRGAGDLDARGHSDALDRLGVDRSCSVHTYHMRLSATMLGDNLGDALPLLTDMVRRPKLPEASLDAGRSLCLQSLASLDDDPQHQVMLELRRRHAPSPFNRSGYGERGVLESASIDDVRSAHATRFVPGGSILSIAGAFDPDAVLARLDALLAGWSGAIVEPNEDDASLRGTVHLERDTSQVHLGVACDAPCEADEASILERLAVNVLSGSTSGRLFTEVRQKRSLCYSVGASYQAGRDRGMISMYAGTTPERAQQTLDVSAEQFDRMRAGVTAEEFRRAQIGLKSRLVMRGESTAARAAAIGQDVFRIGRPRSLDEVASAIDAVSLDAINAYLGSRRFAIETIAAIGPTALTAPPA